VIAGDERVVLAIETSCDETAASVVAGGRTILSSVVSSQVELHARYGGVVPEVAGRAHIERITPVVCEALERAGIAGDGSARPRRGAPGLDAVAVTVGPGLVGALLVGVSFAKSLALSWGVDFIGVNHLEGHLYASFLEEPDLELPVVVLIVSGGHTLLVEMDAPGSYRVVGETVDDAAGEAFDKVARYLGLGYPGGPGIERAAREGDPGAIALPRPMLGDGLDFSFSGLKTAVVHYVDRHPEVATSDVAASFQRAVIDVLAHKAIAAATRSGARGICLAGGVAANGPLRERLALEGGVLGIEVHLPSRSMCTDNAAMIAAAGHFRLLQDGPTAISAGADASLRFPASPAKR
jgi:N6-L-threonylcarbamoyladenine synthase